MTDFEFIYESGTRFDCQGCGQCCRTDWNIPVEPSKADRLQQQGLHLGVVQNPGGTWMTRKSEGRCHFLTEEDLCSVHTELGEPAKPQVCRLFPFVLTPTPDGLHIGLSHYCPSVRASHGRTLAEHETFLRNLLKDQPPSPRLGPMRLGCQQPLGWSGYRFLEEELLERLDRGRPDEVLLGLFSGLCRDPVEWQRHPMDQCFLSPRTQLYSSVELLATDLAAQIGLSMGKTITDKASKSYLSSLVQRKFLIKRDTLLQNLAILGAASLLLRSTPNSDTCVERLEILLTHKPTFRLDTQALVEAEYRHWNGE